MEIWRDSNGKFLHEAGPVRMIFRSTGELVTVGWHPEESDDLILAIEHNGGEEPLYDQLRHQT